MAENKKVQIKNTGGDALYPRTAAESIVNVPGGTMNVFMYINGYGNENQFPDPYKGDRYFDIAAHKVYECVTDTTWTGKKEITSWDSNTLFFWNGEVWKYTDSEEGPLAPVLCATVDDTVTNGVSLNGGNGTPLKAVASSATASQLGTVKTDATVTNGASLVNTNGTIKATVSSATSSQLGTVKITTTESNGVKLGITNGAVSATQTFATNAEAFSGSISSKAVTPSALKYAKTWTTIQDKGSVATVTLAPGEVFKAATPTGTTLKLSAGTVSAGMYGADARLELFIGSGAVSAVSPLIMVDRLTPFAGNNCVIKYRGGYAYLYKEGAEAGYLVNVSSGTGSNTLAHAISTSQGWVYADGGQAYMSFPVSGAFKKDMNIVGNGHAHLTFATPTMSGHTLNIREANITGGTVGAGTAGKIEVAGSCNINGELEMGNNWFIIKEGAVVSSTQDYGSKGVIKFSGSGRFYAGGDAHLEKLCISGASMGHDNGQMVTGGGIMKDVDFEDIDNAPDSAGLIYPQEGAHRTMTDCTFSEIRNSSGCCTVMMTQNWDQHVVMSNCNIYGNKQLETNSQGMGGAVRPTCYVQYRGGALDSVDASFKAENCSFRNNWVVTDLEDGQGVGTGGVGGAITISGSVYGDDAETDTSLDFFGNPGIEFKKCDFTYNSAAVGGAIGAGYVSSWAGVGATFSECLITSNYARLTGGGVSFHGAYNGPHFVSCTIAGNTVGTAASRSTADGEFVDTNVAFTDCTIGNIAAGLNSGGIVLFGGSNHFTSSYASNAPNVQGSALIYISAGAVLNFDQANGLMNGKKFHVGSGNPFYGGNMYGDDGNAYHWQDGGYATVQIPGSSWQISGSATTFAGLKH